MADDLDQRVARRVRELRARRGLSLQALAAGSGVSRSLISVIERGEVHATAVVLERLATGLGVTLASLFDETAQARATTPVARAAEQPPWRDPASGYVRRNVSPAGAGSPIQIVDVSFPPGATVAYETGDREPPVPQAWGDERHRLEAGDCYALRLDRPLSYHNPTRKPARYAVVLVQPGALPDRERT
jgi:transcriptional regulator with XRE-family HTH domain